MTEGMTSKALAMHMTWKDVVSLLDRHEALKKLLGAYSEVFEYYAPQNFTYRRPDGTVGIVQDDIKELLEEAG